MLLTNLQGATFTRINEEMLWHPLKIFKENLVQDLQNLELLLVKGKCYNLILRGWLFFKPNIGSNLIIFQAAKCIVDQTTEEGTMRFE